MAIFKEVVELSPRDRDDEVARLADGDRELALEVEALLENDARTDALTAGGGQGVLAADLLLSMVARGEIAPETEPPPPPDHIGPYRIVGVLGRGGMGVVYEAEQQTPRRRVAIKTVHPWLRSPGFAERFAFEVQTLASLRHRAIPRLYDVREEGDTTWMVMELVRGVPLVDWARGRPLDVRLDLFLEVLDAVHHAHQAGVAHRDLKPSNILVADGHPRVLDFGLAAPLGASPLPLDGACQSDPSRPGVAGTVAYMAPEQLDPDAVPDTRADVYALGVIAHELLTGALPLALPRGALPVIREAKRAAPPPRPASHVSDLRDDMNDVIARAMAPDPNVRYRTAAAFADDLRRYLAQLPVSARAPRLGYRLGLGLRRHRALVRAVIATLVVVGGVAGLVAGLRAMDTARERARAEARAVARLQTLDARAEELLGQGAVAEADALFDAFSRMSENVGTRAMFAAWLRRAERQRRRGRSDKEVRAYAGAYAAAVDEAGQREALRQLGEAFAAAGRWGPVEQVVARLEALGAGAERVTRALAFAAHAWRRDADRVTADPEVNAAAPAVRALLDRAQPLKVLSTSAFPVDPAVGGLGARIAVLDQRRQRLVFFGGGSALARLGEAAVPGDVAYGRAFPRGVTPRGEWVVGLTRDDRVRLWRWTAPADTVEIPLPAVSAAVGEIGPSGALRVVLGSAGRDRRLISATVAGGALERLWRAPASVVGAPSDVDDVAMADLDGDGREEVVAAIGAWNTYDLRVFRREPDGRLRLLTRRRVGSVTTLGVMPRAGAPPLVVATKSDRYPSPTILGPARPFGEAAGIHFYALRGGALEPVAFVPYPPSYGDRVSPHALQVGDFDGDGLEDLAVGVVSEAVDQVLVIRQVAPLRFATAVVGGLDPLLAADLDGDGDDELVARVAGPGDLGWVLGLGSGRVPVLPGPVLLPAPEDLGEASDPGLTQAWRGALDLAAMGLGTAAADELEALARLAPDDRVQARLMARAAGLWLDEGRPARAARGYEEALARGLSGKEARAAELGAGRGWLEAHDLSAARGHYEAVAAAPGAAGAEARRTLSWLRPLAEAPRAPLDLIAGGRLLPALRLTVPEALSRDRAGDGALRVDAFSDADVLAWLPVRFDGGRVRLAVDLDVDHLEIGSGLAVELRPAGGGAAVLRVSVQATGGGLSIEEAAGCGPWDGRGAPGVEVDRASASGGGRLTLRLDRLPAPGDSRCEVHGDAPGTGSAPLALDRRYRSTPLVPGDYELALVSVGEPAWDAVMWGRFRVRRLTVAGLTVRDAPEDARAEANRALYDRDMEAGATLYAGLGDTVGLLLVALSRGDAAAAEAQVAALGGGWEGRGGRLLRLWPDRLAPLLADALGRRELARAYRRAWDVAWRYLDTPETARALQVPALDALDGRDVDELVLVNGRLRMLLRGGDSEAARAGAERALAVAGERRAVTGDPRPDAGERRQVVAEIELLAAAAANMEGDAAGARAHLERWLAAAPAREPAIEALLNQPDFAALARFARAAP